MQDNPLKIYTSQRKLKPTRLSVSGLQSFRSDGHIPFESTLERDFIIRKEYDLSVAQVVAQPVRVGYVAEDGRSRIYTPDFLVMYRSSDLPLGRHVKPELVEVKPKRLWHAKWREWSPRWKAAIAYAKEEGMVFHVVDEDRIRTRALESIKFLRRYSRMEVCDDEVKTVLDCVRERGNTTVDFVLARHFEGKYKPKGLSLIWHLLATRKLSCDLMLGLGLNTGIYVNENER